MSCPIDPIENGDGMVTPANPELDESLIATTTYGKWEIRRSS